MPDIDSTNVVVFLVASLLSGGGFFSVNAYRDSRVKARELQAQERRLDATQPVELSAAAIKGSEGAVLIMQGVNERLVDEVTRLRAAHDQEIAEKNAVIAAKDARIAALERNLDAMYGQLNTANEALVAARQGYDAMKIELEAIKST